MKKLLVGILVAASFAACSDSKKKESSNETSSEVKSVTATAGDMKIGYYVYDSIPNQFDFYKTESAALEKEGSALEQQLMAKQKAGQNLLDQYQRGVQSQTLTPNQIASLEQRIQKAQNDIAVFQQNQMGAFQQKQMQSNMTLQNKINEYSSQFAKENGFTLFLIVGQGSSVAFIDSTFDQTSAFINFMNQEEAKINSAE